MAKRKSTSPRFAIRSACLYYAGGIFDDPLENSGEKMKRLVSILVLVMFVFALGLSALAQKTPSVDNRERRQQKRIHRGVKSGSLTKREAARLEKQQIKTHKMEAKAKSDGKVTVRERA
jgi:preprotein translocase subunit SecG